MRCPVNAYVEFKLRKEDKIKLKLHQSLQLQKIAFGVIFLWMISFNATACDLATTVKNTTIDGIRTFFKSQNKYVVTFVGYSGAEYEDKTAMLEKAGRVLDEFDASKKGRTQHFVKHDFLPFTFGNTFFPDSLVTND
jgi:hypothetical protein